MTLSRLKNYIGLGIFSTIVLVACTKKDVEEENHDNELITTLQLQFTPVGGGATKTFAWKDLDGDGGNAPVIDAIDLPANTTYNFTVKVLDESKNPVEDITAEILEDAANHRFYYVPGEGADIKITNLNKDANNVTLGSTGQWQTSTAVNKNVRVVLRHYSRGGKQEADLINDSKSSTDIDVTFPYIIK
ncbi:hypothetical protein [Polluticaenibacter yanchengensis]|uniref:Type 1 periplasmic binding fold superfamily protein n=1 Tax=Polluticaenibacter yanchengensis TaxID=3014562 RepID=A0ABT4UGJ0_9BACT|nr:hypothetical protein [Chitinophagaceae bacterium LY-5]